MGYPTLGEADPGGLGACPQEINYLKTFREGGVEYGWAVLRNSNRVVGLSAHWLFYRPHLWQTVMRAWKRAAIIDPVVTLPIPHTHPSLYFIKR
jgi:hypothetical protein